MDKLIDANVWLSILDANHSNHPTVSSWWKNIAPKEAVWCRFTQNAVLRLLSNRKVMDTDTHSPEAAWKKWEQLANDDRTAFLNSEPPDLTTHWFANVQGRTASPNLWTDAYLAALAESSGLEMVTFDRGFRKFSLSNLTLLKT